MKPLSRLWIFCLFVFLLPACLEEGENPPDGDADVPDSDLEVADGDEDLADGDGESLPTCDEDWSHPVLAACIAPIEGWTTLEEALNYEFETEISSYTEWGFILPGKIIDSGSGFPTEHIPCITWRGTIYPFNIGAEPRLTTSYEHPSELTSIDDRLKHWLILEDARGQQWFLGFVGIPFLPDLDPEKGVTVEWLAECEGDCHYGSMSLSQDDNVFLALNTALETRNLKFPAGQSAKEGSAYCSTQRDVKFILHETELTDNETCFAMRQAEASYLADSGWLMLSGSWMDPVYEEGMIGELLNPKRFALIRRAADPTGTEIPGYAWTERMCAE